MHDWDADSPQLRKNLGQVLNETARIARPREHPTLESARGWQTLFMKNLKVPDSRFVGTFRGEPGLESIQVRVRTQVMNGDLRDTFRRWYPGMKAGSEDLLRRVA